MDRISQVLRLPSPLDLIDTAWTRKAEIQLYVKRDELIHPHICGNKWRKLKYAISSALHNNYEGLVTFGGAYSNHIVAVAAAAHCLGLKSGAIIRSYQDGLVNPTLELCQSYGMELSYVHPSEYRIKEESPVIQAILAQYPGYLVIPEGGTQREAIQGVGEIIGELTTQVDITHVDTIYVAVGTGGTFAGLLTAIQGRSKVVGISPFKASLKSIAGLDLVSSMYHLHGYIEEDLIRCRYGGYDERIVTEIMEFYKETGIVLDPVYTARLMSTIRDKCIKGSISRGSTVVAVHTGGLQGCRAFNFQYGHKKHLIPDEILRHLYSTG